MTDELEAAMIQQRFTACIDQLAAVVQRFFHGAGFSVQILTAQRVPLQGGSIRPAQVLMMLGALWQAQDDGTATTLDRENPL